MPESDVQRRRKVPESDARSVSYSKAGKPSSSPRSQHKRPWSSASTLPQRGIIHTRVGQQSTNIHVNYKPELTDNKSLLASGVPGAKDRHGSLWSEPR